MAEGGADLKIQESQKSTTGGAAEEDSHIYGSSCLEFEKATVDELLPIYDKLKDFFSHKNYYQNLKEELAVFLTVDKVDLNSIQWPLEQENRNMQRALEHENKQTEKDANEIIHQEIEMRVKDLKRMECGITITGETGSGKTTMLNKLIGIDLVKPRIWASTGKICRIYNSDKIRFCLRDASGKLIEEKHFLNLKTMKNSLKKATSVQKSKEDESYVRYVDIFCPFQSSYLQESILLVDTPGIGESETLTHDLKEILPNAVAFICMVDASNSGGIHEDRLTEILKEIKNALPHMPCFDPCDVLFASSKWDIVSLMASDNSNNDSDTDQEEGDEEESLMKIIVEKIKNVWSDFDEEKIFKLCLKQMDTEIETETKKEFERFIGALSVIIEKNRNKRTQTHLRCLEDIISKIEKGISARIHTVANDIETKSLTEIKETLNTIGTEIDEIKTDLKRDMDESVIELGEQLHCFIHSEEGKKRILNPPDKKPIEIGIFSPKEVGKRLRRGIEDWVKGENVLKEIKRIDENLHARLENINLKLNNANRDLTGKHGYGTIRTSDSKKWLSVSIAVTLYTFFKTIMTAAKNTVTEKRRSMTDIYYGKYQKLLKKDKLTEFIHSVFVSYFQSNVEDIFSNRIPKEINSMKRTIENITRERDQLKKRLKDLECLHVQISNIKKDMQKLL